MITQCNIRNVFVACCLLMAGCSHVYAQKQGHDRLDSLNTALESADNDSVKMVVLRYLSFEYNQVNPQTGIKYGEDLYALAVKQNKPQYEGYAYLNIGVNYLAMSDYPKALANMFRAIDVLERLNDTLACAKGFNNIGIIYFNLINHKKALEYYYKALAIYDRYHKEDLKATTIGNIGLVYQSQGNTDKALYMSRKALGYFSALNEKTGMARMNLNIGDLYGAKGKFALALKHQYAALQLYLELKEVTGIGKTYGDIAYSYLHVAIDPISGILPDSLRNKKELLNKAEFFITKSIDLNRQYGYYERLGTSYDGISKILEAKGDHHGALEYYKKAVEIRDSIYSTNNQQKITEIEVRKLDELNEKTLEIKNLQIASDKWFKIFLASGLGFVLLCCGLIYRNFVRQKHTNMLLGNEKKRSDDLLLNILPEEVAEELKRSGQSVARQYNDVTVLFTDVENFTGISEQLSPTELVKEIHKTFTGFDAIIEKYGLEKIKTIGDAYLAVCGLPNENKHHARQVIQAAMEIQQFITASDSRFRVRIGIHSGPVVAGIVGVKKYAYDIWGDTVNTAARLEQKGDAGKINISGTTYEMVKQEFVCEHRGKIPAKNKGDIDMYFVYGTSEGG